MDTKNLIKNYQDLNQSPLHRDALDIIQAGLESINTETAIRKILKVNNGVLGIDSHTFNLGDFNRVFVIGFGKVACEAGQVIEELLEGHLSGGAVIGINDNVCQIIETFKGTHPLPSESNVVATNTIERISLDADKDDLVVAVIGGGGSALLCSTHEEVGQNIDLYHSFLNSGGEISELNTVRKHLSALKGGGLAKLLYPATVIGLIFSDVPGDDLASVASGPTFYDSTTKDQAEEIINKYNLGNFQLNETPKDEKYFQKVINIPVVTNHTALDAMHEKSTSLGYSSKIVSNNCYCKTNDVLRSMTQASQEFGAVIIGGEWSLQVPAGTSGSGGRNTYLSLLASSSLHENQVFAAFASDGHDNGHAAGALVDMDTVSKMYHAGHDSGECLDSYNCLPGLGAVKCLIDTGYLESNVSDLSILLTDKK